MPGGMLEAFGQPDIIAVTGVAATEIVSLRPEEGEIYIVQEIACQHDDNGGNRDCAMYFSDGTSRVLIGSFSALANATKRFLRNASSAGGVGLGNEAPCVLTRSHYFEWKVNAIAAGKKGYIDAMVYIIKGLPPDVGA